MRGERGRRHDPAMTSLRRATLPLLVATALAGTALPARADGVAAASGSGTINPGLPCPMSGCSVHADVSAAFVGTLPSGAASCTLDGVANGTVVAGAGNVDVFCNGPGVASNGHLWFTWTGPVLSVYAGNVMSALACYTVTGEFAFHWTTTPPVTSFGLNGELQLADC